jgi:hypothetical protein
MTPPLASVTVPERVAVVSWAARVEVPRMTTPIRAAKPKSDPIVFKIFIFFLPPS